MIYLDYAATTPAHPSVLSAFKKAAQKYIGNPNSGHELGLMAAKAIDKALTKMRHHLHLPSSYELIPTSGATEANNLAWQGVLNIPENKGKHIITTAFEHSSITANANYYARNGFRVDILTTDKHGHVDLNHLRSLLCKDTILVSVCSVNSEIGNRQPIQAIVDIIKGYPSVYFHSDVTQSIGKEPIELDGIDLISMTAHKFYGVKGIGLLIKKKKRDLTPIIRGGHSTTAYRRGTPATELVVSMERALKLAMQGQITNYDYVVGINEYAREHLSPLPNIVFNSEATDSPFVFNFSLPGCSSQATVTYLSQRGIYISNHTACESDADLSSAILSLTSDQALATSSVRLSFSYLTTIEEIDRLIEVLRGYCK